MRPFLRRKKVEKYAFINEGFVDFKENEGMEMAGQSIEANIRVNAEVSSAAVEKTHGSSPKIEIKDEINEKSINLSAPERNIELKDEFETAFSLEVKNDFEDANAFQADFEAFFQKDEQKNEKGDDTDNAFQPLTNEKLQNVKNEKKKKKPAKKVIFYIGSSDEEVEPEDEEKKEKTKVAKKRCSVQNLINGNAFLHSEANRRDYISEIEDPLKRAAGIKSDLSLFKHVPVWEQRKMKRSCSDPGKKKTVYDEL